MRCLCWKSLPDTAAYVRRILAGEDVQTERETLSTEDRRLEAVALQLRTAEGIAESTLLSGGPNPVESLIEQAGLSARAANALAAFLKLIRDLSESVQGLDLPTTVEEMLSATGLKAHVEKSKDGKGIDRVENLEELDK